MSYVRLSDLADDQSVALLIAGAFKNEKADGFDAQAVVLEQQAAVFRQQADALGRSTPAGAAMGSQADTFRAQAAQLRQMASDERTRASRDLMMGPRDRAPVNVPVAQPTSFSERYAVIGAGVLGLAVLGGVVYVIATRK